MKPRRTIGSRAAIDMLGKKLTYRQLTHWISTGIIEVSGQGVGSGTSHKLNLEDVLRLRAMALLVSNAYHGWSLRDAAGEIKAKRVADLLEPITLEEDRAKIEIDLSLKDDETELREWIDEEALVEA